MANSHVSASAFALLLLTAGRAAPQELPHSQADSQNVRLEDVAYQGGDVQIAATLYVPESRVNVPAIIVIHGAEGITRHTPMYRENAMYFASQGFAVLLWDKRGIGGTPGTYQETRDFRESARDVIAGVEFLRTAAGIDPDRIGVYGVSQGGWIGPLAASMSPNVAFVIANSGPGVSVNESNLAQRANEWLEDGYTEADTAEIKSFLRITWRYYGTGEGLAQAQQARDRVRDRPWFRSIGFPDSTPSPSALQSPRYDFYRRGLFDPDTILPKVRVPVLALFGEHDRHIPMPESAKRFEAILRRSNHPDFTVRTFKGAGHGLRVVPDGQRERLRPEPGSAPRHGAHEYVPEFRPFLTEWLSKRGRQ